MKTKNQQRAKTQNQKLEVLFKILATWVAMPDLRLGQLLVAAYQQEHGGADIFYIEDYELLELVEKLAKEESK